MRKQQIPADSWPQCAEGCERQTWPTLECHMVATYLKTAQLPGYNNPTVLGCSLRSWCQCRQGLMRVPMASDRDLLVVFLNIYILWKQINNLLKTGSYSIAQTGFKVTILLSPVSHSFVLRLQACIHTPVFHMADIHSELEPWTYKFVGAQFPLPHCCGLTDLSQLHPQPPSLSPSIPEVGKKSLLITPALPEASHGQVKA